MVTTKGGDKGKTSLYDGTRVAKNAKIIHFLGTMDTMTSFLGLAKSKITRFSVPKELEIFEFIEGVQRQIIILNGMAASTEKKKSPKNIDDDLVTDLEIFEKDLMDTITLKPEFILQGKNELSATFDVARTYCRKAERRIVGLILEENREDLQIPQKYLNRLADVLYIIARYIDQKLEVSQN